MAQSQDRAQWLAIQALDGRELDFKLYQLSCQWTNRPTDAAAFEAGYEQGRFHFSEDAAFLADLVSQFELRLQLLAGEWLASTDQHGQYGKTPLEAACRVVLAINGIA